MVVECLARSDIVATADFVAESRALRDVNDNRAVLALRPDMGVVHTVASDWHLWLGFLGASTSD
jgi:hypothetical protein